MALRISYSSPATNQFINPLSRASSRKRMVMMHHNSRSQAQKPIPVKIIKYFPTQNKVFEDESRGVVCYRDEDSGEIVCEGLDESPRPCIQLPSTPPAYHLRKLGIVDLLLLQQSSFQAVGDV